MSFFRWCGCRCEYHDKHEDYKHEDKKGKIIEQRLDDIFSYDPIFYPVIQRMKEINIKISNHIKKYHEKHYEESLGLLLSALCDYKMQLNSIYKKAFDLRIDIQNYIIYRCKDNIENIPLYDSIEDGCMKEMDSQGDELVALEREYEAIYSKILSILEEGEGGRG